MTAQRGAPMTTPDFDCTPTTCTGCTSAACVSRTREDEKR